VEEGAEGLVQPLLWRAVCPSVHSAPGHVREAGLEYAPVPSLFRLAECSGRERGRHRAVGFAAVFIGGEGALTGEGG